MEDGGSLAGKLDSIVSSRPVSRELYGLSASDDGNERGVDMSRLLQDRCQRGQGDGRGGGRQSASGATQCEHRRDARAKTRGSGGSIPVPSSGDGDRGVRRRAASVTRTVPSPGANFRTLVMPSTETSSSGPTAR